MPLELRPATLADTPALVRLMLELGYDTDEPTLRRRLGRVLALGDHAVFVGIEAPHGIVGLIHVGAQVTLLERPYAEIGALVVAGVHRRSGVGRLLMERAHDWAARRGLQNTVVRAQPHRKAAHAFYRSLGYTVTKQHSILQRELGAPPPTGIPTVMD
jgi:GNAT superfamily N-acetyltransferase